MFVSFMFETLFMVVVLCFELSLCTAVIDLLRTIGRLQSFHSTHHLATIRFYSCNHTKDTHFHLL